MGETEPRPCMSRRNFLIWGGSTVTVVGLSSLSTACGGKRETTGGAPIEEEYKAVVSTYPRKRIAALSDLNAGVPIHFKYPTEDPLMSASFVVKLGQAAGGAIGPDKDIVAFNAICPHMGGPLMGQYKHELKAIGPCPLHLSSYDLTKHGMIIAGHATESLPQVVLALEGDDVYATGMMGLIYGSYASAEA